MSDNNLAHWLRDFAAANNEDFEPEQIQNLVYSANLIENLIAERDEARWEVCELSSNGSVDDSMRVSVERGWSNPTTTQYWCDSCGDAIEIGNEFFYSELPCDIDSANKGESATVCRKCDKKIEADFQNEEYRNDRGA